MARDVDFPNVVLGEHAICDADIESMAECHRLFDLHRIETLFEATNYPCPEQMRSIAYREYSDHIHYCLSFGFSYAQSYRIPFDALFTTFGHHYVWFSYEQRAPESILEINVLL